MSGPDSVPFCVPTVIVPLGDEPLHQLEVQIALEQVIKKHALYMFIFPLTITSLSVSSLSPKPSPQHDAATASLWGWY